MSSGIVKSFQQELVETNKIILNEKSFNISEIIVPFSSFHEFYPSEKDICIKENESEFKNILKKEFLDAIKKSAFFNKNF